MSKETKKEIRKILQTLNPDTIGTTKGGCIICRWGYFYRHGITDLTYAEAVMTVLSKNNIQYSNILSGDHWATFKGGASVAKSSHFWVEIELAD